MNSQTQLAYKKTNELFPNPQENPLRKMTTLNGYQANEIQASHLSSSTHDSLLEQLKTLRPSPTTKQTHQAQTTPN